MSQNVTCAKCGEMSKFWREVEFVSASENEDSFGIVNKRLCSKCINEIWGMIKKFLQS